MAVRTEQPFIIERMLQPGDVIDERIAVCGDIMFARASFDIACEMWPDDRLILRHGARVIRKRPADLVI